MEWKDIWTEILLKAGVIKPERLRRKPAFARHEIRELIATASIIKNRLLTEIENRISRRSITSSYLFTDNKIFEPFIDLMMVNLQGREFHSYVFEIGLEIKRFVETFEAKKRIKINKTDLFFGIALCSVYNNSTINASIYWELSQQEEANTQGARYNPIVSLQNTIQRFSSAISPIEYGLRENTFYNRLLDNYTWIGDFKTNMLKLHDPETFSYFSSGLRNRAIAYWLKVHFTDMTKMYGQELLNSLCILGESLLKAKPAVTHQTLGKIINYDLVVVNPVISAKVGTGHTTPKTGFWITYPTNTTAEFNTNFPRLINHINTNTLSDDELKAHLVWGLYMLRNKALHDYDPTLCYYGNSQLFLDAIGLALACVPSIENL